VVKTFNDFLNIYSINLGENNFKLMENIARFAQAARAYGLSDSETFQTVDLYEKMNLHQVILCLFALGRKVNHFPIKKICFI
jgi:4-aminobutyrate aminotransferase-like enzyme